MASMKAIAFNSFGPPDVLQLVDLPDPEPGAGQVRIKVRAAGVQPFDTALRAGWRPAGLTVTFPQVPGNEHAGVVDEVGEAVSGWQVGDEVLGFGTLNSYAELLVTPADQIVAKPADMPWEVAGGFTAGAQTSHLALSSLGVGPGDTVLIHAAAGTVGTVAVQLAQLWGATVIGTASEANHDYLRSLGAVPVQYGEGLVERVRAIAPRGVDAALDAAGGDALTASLELVADHSRILTIVEVAAREKHGLAAITGQRSAARLAEMVDLWEQGKLHIHVRRSYPLMQAADAHRDVETRHGRGKIILTVD
jgi:NADPH:quinone reductase-like Zn-dependent oxidoreductase